MILLDTVVMIDILRPQDNLRPFFISHSAKPNNPK
jgi:predicted nucleic acid-binding protein